MADPVWVDGVTPLSSVNLTKLQTRDEKAAANGYPSLDGTGKVPAAQLPASASLTYRGAYNAATVYADGDTVVGADGVTYMCMIGGTVGVTPSPWAPWSVAVPTVVNGQWLKGVGGAAVWTPITPADIAGYPADGTKALFGDGTWKAPGGGAAIASFVRNNYTGADIALSNSTVTTVITQAVTMPASGGPFKASVSWLLAWNTTSGATNPSGYVNDQIGSTQNVFAEAQQTYTPGGVGGAIAGSGISINSYANGATVNFILVAAADGGWTVTASQPRGGKPFKTYVAIAILPSAV